MIAPTIVDTNCVEFLRSAEKMLPTKPTKAPYKTDMYKYGIILQYELNSPDNNNNAIGSEKRINIAVKIVAIEKKFECIDFINRLDSSVP
jgi:hypothetical protein